MIETKPITNRRPTKEDANGFGLVQYYRNDFGECGEDMIIDARAILDVCDELENL